MAKLHTHTCEMLPTHHSTAQSSSWETFLNHIAANPSARVFRDDELAHNIATIDEGEEEYDVDHTSDSEDKKVSKVAEGQLEQRGSGEVLVGDVLLKLLMNANNTSFRSDKYHCKEKESGDMSIDNSTIHSGSTMSSSVQTFSYRPTPETSQIAVKDQEMISKPTSVLRRASLKPDTTPTITNVLGITADPSSSSSMTFRKTASFSNDDTLMKNVDRKHTRALTKISAQYDFNNKGYLDEVEQLMRACDVTERGYLSKEEIKKIVEKELRTKKHVVVYKKIVVGLACLLVILALSNFGTSGSRCHSDKVHTD